MGGPSVFSIGGRTIILYVSSMRWMTILLSALMTSATWGADLELQAQAASMTLGKALKTRLLKALEAGDVAGAVAVCREEAPALADAISRDLGLSVGRTSLRVRNPYNQPDAWEKAGLLSLQQRLTEGEDAAAIAHSEWVEKSPEEKEFRYLKPIVTEPLCLTCHGDPIAPDVAKVLGELYPEDQAIGYTPGELRGAFTVRISGAEP